MENYNDMKQEKAVLVLDKHEVIMLKNACYIASNKWNESAEMLETFDEKNEYEEFVKAQIETCHAYHSLCEKLADIEHDIEKPF